MLLDKNSFFDCNKATLELFGCKSVEEFSKLHPADLSPPTQTDGKPSMDAAMSHIQKAFETGTDHFLWVHKRVGGTTFPADVLLTRMPYKNRDVLQATVRDITEQKKIEDSLRQTKDLLELQVNRMPIGCIIWDKDFRAISWNPAAEAIFGFSAQEVLGKNVAETIVPKDAKSITDEIWRRCWKAMRLRIVLMRISQKMVEIYICSWTNTPLRREDQSVIGVLSMVQDVTKSKLVEHALQESQKRLWQAQKVPILVLGILTL